MEMVVNNFVNIFAVSAIILFMNILLLAISYHIRLIKFKVETDLGIRTWPWNHFSGFGLNGNWIEVKKLKIFQDYRYQQRPPLR